MAQPCSTDHEVSTPPSLTLAPGRAPAPDATTDSAWAVDAVKTGRAVPKTAPGAGSRAKPLKGRLHYRRLWLNRPGYHGRAHVLSEVHLDRNSDGIAIRAEFLLADCSRSVTLDFDMYENASAADRRNALRKARLFRESVNAFCDAVELAATEYEAERAAERTRRRRPRRA